MRALMSATVVLLGLAALPALAQFNPDTATGARPGHDPGVGISLPMSDRASNNGPSDTRSPVAPTLPTPGVGAGGTPRDYLTAARAALAAGQTGQAQEALERAETRALDRPVTAAQMRTPNDSQLIARIGAARRALGHGDRAQALALALIDQALAN